MDNVIFVGMDDNKLYDALILLNGKRKPLNDEELISITSKDVADYLIAKKLIDTENDNKISEYGEIEFNKLHRKLDKDYSRLISKTTITASVITVIALVVQVCISAGKYYTKTTEKRIIDTLYLSSPPAPTINIYTDKGSTPPQDTIPK